MPKVVWERLALTLGDVLPLEQVLGDLLASDELQVASELVVYEALALWVQADKPARLPAFHALFGARRTSLAFC